jgi:hypothetical protein
VQWAVVSWYDLTALRQGIGIWSEQIEQYYIAIAMIKDFEETIVILHSFTKPGGVENRPAVKTREHQNRYH